MKILNVKNKQELENAERILNENNIECELISLTKLELQSNLLAWINDTSVMCPIGEEDLIPTLESYRGNDEIYQELVTHFTRNTEYHERLMKADADTIRDFINKKNKYNILALEEYYNEY